MTVLASRRVFSRAKGVYSASLDHLTVSDFIRPLQQTARPSSSPRLKNLFDVLAAVLESGLLIMQLLFKIGNVFLQLRRLGRQAIVDGFWRDGDEPRIRVSH